VRPAILPLALVTTWLFTAPLAASPLRERHTLPYARPLTIAATRGSFVGAVAPATPISVIVKIAGQHQGELQQVIASLTTSDTLSPRYLTPAEYGRYFGATPADYAGAIATLRAAGFTIDELPANRTDIIAHAPAGRVEALFSTPLDWRNERGQIFFTARYEPTIPQSLHATAISGLDTYLRFHPHSRRSISRKAKPPSWTPDDLAAGYNLAGLYSRGLDGKGITIANATSGEASGNDLTAFQQYFGLPVVPLVSHGVGGPLSPTCGQGCNNSESTLDADSATSIAREATFVQVVAHTPSNHDFDLAYEYIVNNLGSTVHVVTTSWGICERDFKNSKSFPIDDALFKQAVAEGQFWFSASGDNGTDDCQDGQKALSVDFPGSSPFVVSVGGTNITGVTNGQGAVTGWSSETAWQYANSNGASGGGQSIIYPKPAYQRTLTPKDNVRDVPDVALISDPENDGVYVYNGSLQGHWGGTSDAAPMWAALFAIIVQREHGKAPVDPHLRLYRLAAGPSYHNVFHDITSGYNGVPTGSFKGFYAGPGFDLTTGLGSFNGGSLVDAY
jgi:subtilase family serine protease